MEITIDQIQEKLEKKKYGIYQDIIELIIEAVFDYPIYDLVSGSLVRYFDEIKKEIGCSELTLQKIESYLDKPKTTYDENDIWKHSSISTLYEAFHLMEIKGISLKKIMDVMLNE